MDKFKYQYQKLTSNEQKEVETIIKKYVENDVDSQIERIQRYDRKTKILPVGLLSFFIIFGILVFGVGLTFVLEWQKLGIGCCLMLLGTLIIVLFGLLYPKILQSFKKYYGKKIVIFSQEVLKEEQ